MSFKHRDVRLLNDEEYREVEHFVEDEQRYEQGRLEAVMFESNEIAGTFRYVATTRHEGRDDAEPSEYAGSGDDS